MKFKFQVITKKLLLCVFHVILGTYTKILFIVYLIFKGHRVSGTLSGNPTIEPVGSARLKQGWDNGEINHEVGGEDMAENPQAMCRDTQVYLLPNVEPAPVASMDT